MHNLRVKENNDEEMIRFEEIPPPQSDMKYRVINSNLLKYFTNVVRASYEYRSLIQHIKNFLDVNRCAFYEGYSIENGFTIELHHAPFTMYDICEAVAQRQFKENGGWIRTFIVCEEVAQLHYNFKVGLVPLNPTAHELVHSGVLEIHPDLVLGYWKEFYNEYESYLSDESKEKYKRAIEMEKTPPEKQNIMKRKEVKIVVNQFKALDNIDITQLIVDSKVLNNPHKQIEEK